MSRVAGGGRSRGFSLAEVMVAVFVLAVGVLGIVAVFSYSQESTHHAAMTSHAVGLCRQAVESIRAQNLPFASPLNPGLVDSRPETWANLRAVNASPLTDLPPDPDFRRRVKITQRLGTSGYLSEIAAVEVTVYWLEKERLRKVTMTAHHRKP